jgi:hypothetical protein
MLTLFKTSRDKSGQSGQPNKHWERKRPDWLSRLQPRRDKKLPQISAPDLIACAPVPINIELDCAIENTRPMSRPERTAA